MYTEQELELFQTLRNKLAAIRTTSKHAQDASLAMERAWGAKSAASLATPTGMNSDPLTTNLCNLLLVYLASATPAGAALPSTSRQPEVHPQKRRQVMCQTPRSSVDEDKSKKQVDLMRGGGEAKQSSSQLPAVTSMPLQDDQAGQNWLVISCSRSLPKHVGALSSIISQLGTAPQQLSSELTTEMKTVEK